MDDLPYKAEYAKSGRASCRACKSPIDKDSLRLAVMVQSPAFDGKVPNWYHYLCFFVKQRPKTTDDINHFESLRWEDQEKIKEKIKNSTAVIVPEGKGKGKGKKRGVEKESLGALKDFTLEYAKSGRAVCRGCELKILKDEVRISKKDFETEVGRKYGGQDMWHHLTCFAKLRSELGYYASGDLLPGYKTLSAADKKDVVKHLPPIKQEEGPSIKKLKSEEDEVDSGLETKMKEQNEIMFKYRDSLKKNLGKNDLQYLLEYNNQDIPAGDERMLDRLSDIMAFGTLLPCTNCSGQLVFDNGGYVCRGDLTEWTKCGEMIKEPKRKAFKVPKELASEHSFLKKYKYVPRTRLCKEANPTNKVKKEEENGKPKIERERPRLYEMTFVILGDSKKSKDEIKKEITKLGGKVITKISESLMAVISTKEMVEKMGARMCDVKDADVHVVAEDFIAEVKKSKTSVPELIKNLSICDWGSDPNKRLPAEPSTSKSKSRSIYTSSVPSKVTLKVKGGTTVDPDSGLADKAHVYSDGGDKYTSVLGITDLQKQKNSFYKLQVLKADNGTKWWVFRSWGRIGTTIGGNKLEPMATKQDALRQFKELYEEKTGNIWDLRDDFVKVPGRMYPIDIDYGEDEAAKLEVPLNTPSKLQKPVQDLMHLIFNIETMKNVMMEFELDCEKMPLGKLSKSQLKKALEVLGELQTLIDGKPNKSKLLDACNRFYTFLPHACGTDELPLLDSTDAIKQKSDMIDSLMEMEIAYNLMKSSSSAQGGLDGQYEQLKAEIDILERGCEEFKIIEEYVKNTHAPTHTNYGLQILNVFTVKRQGEEKRFKPFKKLHNRKLLWHGSRVTNFAGIISQGLRIAPPEAPVTGYMFGKGIYFADMVSKSANYCCTGMNNPTGLLLLCDVALGDMYEKTRAEYVEKLPKGKHSTKGIGRTQPDSKNVKKIGDIEVPVGKPVQCATASDLLYNEYIVYDIAQVNAKYLVQMNFKFKY